MSIYSSNVLLKLRSMGNNREGTQGNPQVVNIITVIDK